jgi:hypothetical protein
MWKHVQTESIRKIIKDILKYLTFFLHMNGVRLTRFIRNRNLTSVVWAVLKSYVLQILKYTDLWNTEGLYIHTRICCNRCAYSPVVTLNTNYWCVLSAICRYKWKFEHFYWRHYLIYHYITLKTPGSWVANLKSRYVILITGTLKVKIDVRY